MAKRKISISFKEKYTDVYLYLMQLKNNNENISEYICKLLQADMNGNLSLHQLGKKKLEKS